ncbi:MAG TPA: hypothetical protein VMG10_24770 [Gemmataceae bacterium]|nr:hypothetical protein [Gemmataceae bacterium]
MNRKRMVLAVVAVLVLAALGWLVSLSKTSQAAPVPSADAAFKGKVLFVQAGGGMMPSFFLLEKAQMQKIGDRSCLVGKGAADGPLVGWHKGRTVWLPMEQIVSITEFDDAKDAKKFFKSGGGGMPIGMYAPVGEPLPTTSAPGTVPTPAGSPPAPPPPSNEGRKR